MRALGPWRTLAALVLGVACLFALSETVLDAFPNSVEIGATAASLTVATDGQTHVVQVTRPVSAVRLTEPPPLRREYQVDGSDSTNNFTLDLVYFATVQSSAYYRLQAFLRDESSYSTWRNLVVRDPSGKQVVALARPEPGNAYPFPAGSRLRVELHRLESPAAVELVDLENAVVRVELDRNDKALRVEASEPNMPTRELGKWFFPEDPLPYLAELAYFVLRAIGAGLAFVLLGLTLARGLPAAPAWKLGRRWPIALAVACVALALAGSLYAAVGPFDRSPHVLDAVSYYIQGRIFASGALSAPAPSPRDAFPTPFMVVHEGRWFSQYPPGTSLTWAIGLVAGVPWLVGPALAALAVLLVFLTGRRQLGEGTGLIAAALMASSPFLYLQAGSFLSHLPAMAYASLFLYAATRFEQRPTTGWAALAAVALGMTFWTREIVAVIYGLAFGVFCLVRGWRVGASGARRGTLAAAIVLVPFALGYLGYDTALTGSPWRLPRSLFNGADRFGFGDGVGFYGQHTLAAGLVNTDELLTSLTITLFGWPFYTALALVLLPFVLGRAGPWERAHGAVLGLYVAAYVAYFYHGIALGPRYYFEALPSLSLLAARGFGACADVAARRLVAWQAPRAWPRARLAVAALGLGLLACNALYFLPRQAALYEGHSGLPGGGGPRAGSFVDRTLTGRASALDDALVTTPDWWIYATYLAALNCPGLDCATVFAFAPDSTAVERLRSRYPRRRVYVVQNRGGTLEAEPLDPAQRPGG